MDTNTFAELLLFIRTHPDQRRQLRRALMHAEVEMEEPVTADLITAKDAIEQHGIPANVIGKFADQHAVPKSVVKRVVHYDRARLQQAVRKQYALGWVTVKDAAQLAESNTEYIIRGCSRGYWTIEHGWVVKQDLLEHYMRTGNAATRAAIVARVEAFDEAHQVREVRVIAMPVAVEREAPVQMEMAL